jgi:hypothetical protein
MSNSSAITTALFASAYSTPQTDLFSRIDANGDGQISPDEMSAFGQNLPGAEGRGLKDKNLFQKIDSNGDGVVTKEEWAAHRAARERTQNALLKLQEQSGNSGAHKHHHGPSGARPASPGATFNALDTNKDGIVSAEEWAAAYGGNSGVTVSSDVKPVGAATDSGLTGTINAALDGTTNVVKGTVNTIAQTLNSLL